MIQTSSNRHLRFSSALLAFLLVLSGCASVSQTGDITIADGDFRSTSDEAIATKEKPPLRPLEPETLFDLLVGDFAAAKQQYGLQFNRYHKQAIATRDLGLVTKATWLAIQLNAAQQALELAQLWVDLEPDNTDANRITGYYLAFSGQSDKALPYALKTLRSNDTEAIYAVARQLVEITPLQQQQLHAELTRLTATDGQFVDLANHPQVALLDANLLLLNNKPQAAINRVTGIAEPDTDRDSSLLLIAQATLQQSGLDSTLAFLEQQVAKYPDSKRLRLQLARQWSEKDLQRSRAELNKLVEQFPEDHRLSYSLALINAQLGFPEQAVALLSKLIDVDEHRDNVHYQLGLINEQGKRLHQAIDHYQQVSQGEFYGKAVTAQIRLLAATDRDDELNQLTQHLVSVAPDQAADAYLDIAAVLAGSQQQQRALTLLSTALKNYPDNGQLLYNRSLLFEQQGDTAKSHRDLRTAIALQPDNPDTLNALGYSLTNSINSSDYPEAHRLIKQALALDPENPAILDSMGWALFRLNRFEDALLYLRQAFKLFPDAEVAAHLGEVLWQMGQHTEALDIWENSLAQNPESPYIINTMERLGASRISQRQPAL